jgi:hypothetical protein
VGETENTPRPRRGALVGTYATAVVVGCLLGYLPGRSPSSGGASSTPLARVGLALQADAAATGPEAWAALRADVEAVRAGGTIQDRDAFDLVVALRGLATDGDSDWDGAQKLCQRLAWPRCDRAALEEMKRRSRP